MMPLKWLVPAVSASIVMLTSGLFGCSASAPSRRDAGASRAVDAGQDAPSLAPVLTALSVAGSTGEALVPQFSPETHDYYVRCAAGANPLTVAMTASASAASVLKQPFASKPAPTQTVAVTAMENQALVAAATDGVTTTSYWVRCLPHDFPTLHMTRHPGNGPPPGYYLVGNFLPVVGQGSYAMVLDGNGVPVWYFLGASGGMGDVDQVVSGAVSFISYGTPMAGFDVRMLEPLSTTPLAPSGTLVDGHELQVVPGGHYVVLSNPVETGVDLTGIAIPLPDGGTETFGPGSSIQGCNLVEFDSTGAVAWQWIGSDHLDPVKDTTLPALATSASLPDAGGPLVDPYHCNSIDVDPANGNLLVSARNMDSIFYVDRATGAIVWKMGGTPYTKDGAAYVTMADPFYRQHDARLLPGWSPACGGKGEISVFDDESQRAGPARGVLYDVVVGIPDGGATGCAEGGSPGAARVVWQYRGAVSSAGVGSFRLTADESRIIGWGFGAPNLVFTEVDADGGDLLDFEFTDGSSSYRAIKVPLTTFDLDAMRSTAGLP